MSKTVPGGLSALVSSETSTLAVCWKLIATNGTTLYSTAHTENIVIGTETYKSVYGFSPATVPTIGGLAVDTVDLETLFDTSGIKESDLLAGTWDFARMEFFIVDWSTPANGIIKLRRGTVGQLSTKRVSFTTEIRGMMEAYTRELLEVYVHLCRANLGDTRCGVRLSPSVWAATTAYTKRTTYDATTGSLVKPISYNGAWFYCSTAGTSGGSEPSWNTTVGATTNDGTVVWTAIAAMTVSGTVATVTSRRIFTDTSLTQADNFFRGGLLTWVTGANAGRTMEVKQWTLATKQMELALPMASAIGVGDTYSVHRGCDKGIETCKTTFDNSYNFRGEPYIPQKVELAVSEYFS